MTERKALFISHATPEQNDFTVWLGSKLAEVGYDVWADVFRLLPGDDWSRKLEDALREKSVKVLLAADSNSVEKQGVRNEIQIASDVARKVGDKNFIIPLKLGRFDAPFLIAQSQYIDFEDGWAKGLLDLLDGLRELDIYPDKESNSTIWRDLRLSHAKRLSDNPEDLISNWLQLSSMPTSVSFFVAHSGVPENAIRSAQAETWLPSVNFRNGFLAHARLDEVQNEFGPAIPLKKEGTIETKTFMREGWRSMGILPGESRRLIVNLVRQAVGAFLVEKGLSQLPMGGRSVAWWGPGDVLPDGQIAFDFGKWSGRRKIRGYSRKRGVHWYFGISPYFRFSPFPHINIRSRLVFSDDGAKPLESVSRSHQLRRSFAKGWRNARWRDMQLAFLYWLADGEDLIQIEAGGGAYVFGALPVGWQAPRGIKSGDDRESGDDDDPSLPDPIEDFGDE